MIFSGIEVCTAMAWALAKAILALDIAWVSKFSFFEG
jgi:hypothetical protein